MNKFEFTNNLISFNQHNSFGKIPRIINDLNLGKSIALVSDAGMPSICDPGENLIKQLNNKGISIVCIPGPCAALTAIVSSGFPSSRFVFEGFLPRKKSEREKILLEISENLKTTIIYESPNRLMKLLSQLKEHCGGQREIKVFRELTKKFEEHVGDTLDEVLEFFENKKILGEITLVIKGINRNEQNLEFQGLYLKKEIDELIEAGLSFSAAAKYLAKKNNLSKNYIYKLYYN